MDTTSAGSSDQSDAVNLSACSPQVQTLYPLMAGYRDEVNKLWADTADEPGPRNLQNRGHRYLVSLYYEMQKRAVTDNKPMSLEFQNLVFFCRYVGPRPTARHSLHRLDNDQGYRIGNVEWADKRKQAEVRRTAQHHLYLGRRLTDRQLAEILLEKGRPTTTAAIKKFRQRQMKRGVTPAEVTRLIFEKRQLPYESSSDPVESWDFPPEFHAKLTPTYQSFRRQGETRIVFFIRWLKDKSDELIELMWNPSTTSDQIRVMESPAFRYRSRADWAKEELKSLHRKKVDKVIEQLVQE